METGKSRDSFSKLFQDQMSFQKMLLLKLGAERSPVEIDSISLPMDNVEWFKYHCLAMMEELGEVMGSDKRWKTHRNERYDENEKVDELADVFITMCNMCMYSGFSAERIYEAVEAKIEKNRLRLESKLREAADEAAQIGLSPAT